MRAMASGDDAALFAFDPNASVEAASHRPVRHPGDPDRECLSRSQACCRCGVGPVVRSGSRNLYPGIRAAMPEGFSGAFRAWVGPILQRKVDRDTSFFSVVATASEDLLPIQRIPHYDSTDPDLFAAVIYLCDQPLSRNSLLPASKHRVRRDHRTERHELPAGAQQRYASAWRSRPAIHRRGQRAVRDLFLNELQFNSAVVYPPRVSARGADRETFQPAAEPGRMAADRDGVTASGLAVQGVASAVHPASGRRLAGEGLISAAAEAPYRENGRSSRKAGIMKRIRSHRHRLRTGAADRSCPEGRRRGNRCADRPCREARRLAGRQEAAAGLRLLRRSGAVGRRCRSVR